MPNRNNEDLALFQYGTDQRIMVSGNEAYARGLYEAGVQFFATYPGTPTSEIGDLWQEYAKKQSDVWFDLSVNETIAFEAAVGACWAGVRSAVAFKHLGMNLISDALHTVMYAGIAEKNPAGLVIICGGDPEITSSSNAQDIRLFALHTKIPILEPATIQECKDFVVKAMELSEFWGIPVLIYSPTRLSHASGIIRTKQPIRENILVKDRFFFKNFNKYNNVIHWARNNQKKLNTLIEKITLGNFPKDYSPFTVVNSSFQFQIASGATIGKHNALHEPITQKKMTIGFITSGICWVYLEELCFRFKIDPPRLRFIISYPIEIQPLLLFLQHNHLDLLIILEEQESFLELQIKNILIDSGVNLPVIGKRTFPIEGALSPDVIAHYLGVELHYNESSFSIELFLQQKYNKPKFIEEIQMQLPIREPTFCPGCSHRNIFYALKKATHQYQEKSGQEPIFGGDIGCYSMGMSDPYHAIDWLICMGAGVGIANGMGRVIDPKRQYIIAFIGDSTFFHTGIQPIINLAKEKVPILVIILDNYYSAMTGHQISPSTPCEIIQQQLCSDRPPISIQQVISAIAPYPCKIFDGYSLKKMQQEFLESIERPGLKFIIVSAECALSKSRKRKERKKSQSGIGTTTRVNITEYCVKCNECFERLGCTAIQDRNGQYVIDQNRCLGELCLSCLEVCPNHAIRKTIYNPHIKEKKKSRS